MYYDCWCVRLFTFPSHKMDKERRQRWLTCFQRANVKHMHKFLEPSACHRVCSRHFSSGRPTLENPDPDQNLGHEKFSVKRKCTDRSKRMEKRHAVVSVADHESSSLPIETEHTTAPEPAFSYLSAVCNKNKTSFETTGHTFVMCRFICFILLCLVRKFKQNICHLEQKIAKLTAENIRLKAETDVAKL